MRSVSNALRLLLLLSEQEEIRLSDASEQLGLSVAATHRLFATLKSHSFVEQTRVQGPYSLGSVLHEIAERRNPERLLIEAAKSELLDLAERTGETSNLLCLRGPDVVFVDGVEGDQALRVATRVGDRIPAYATASGKVMLARLDSESIWDLYPHGVSPLTGNTVRSVLDLVSELKEVRVKGYAVNVDESLAGVVAIGVAIEQRISPVSAAVTLSMPSQRYPQERTSQFIDELERSAARIAAEMQRLSGARGPAI